MTLVLIPNSPIELSHADRHITDTRHHKSHFMLPKKKTQPQSLNYLDEYMKDEQQPFQAGTRWKVVGFDEPHNFSFALTDAWTCSVST